jgi:hypothetical protein
VNPKDFILFGKDDFEVVSLWKDNAGDKVYLEETASLTMSFPSDYGMPMLKLR